MPFLDDDYLLNSDTARALYRSVRDLPIVDAHNHADVAAILRNDCFADIWEAEAATDHYVWELLRKRGVPETHITGNAPNREKWLALADVFDDLAGNPTYEWIHLDLRRRLGITTEIQAGTGAEIWEQSRERLQQDSMRPQALIREMKVEAMCSTDDPLDDLKAHAALAETELRGVVRPTFRPDKAMNVFRPDWPEYVGRLGERVGTKLKSAADLVAALQTCHDYFADHGCVASDHGLEIPYGFDVDAEDADSVFRKAMARKNLDMDECIAFMSWVLHQVGEMDADKGWVFQLHIGAVRDVRNSLFNAIGPDAGGDLSDHTTEIVTPIREFLNRFDGRLKVVLYALDPGHQSTLAGLTRAFGKDVNLGPAWWLNDSPIGMRRQLEYIGSVDLLANYSGMVSDSRKLLSYGSRNEMFRRVLCDVLGGLVNQGQMPLRIAERLAPRLAYDRPKELFGL